MSIIPRLFQLYRDQGIGVVSGLNAMHWNGSRAAPFTWFTRNGKSCTDGLGIALQELFFLECLFQDYSPEGLFIIGNSFGWSTLAIALLNPRSKVVAIDAGFGRNTLAGLDLTNQIARAAGLNVVAVRAISPQDIPSVFAAHFGAPPEFAFIDGLHTNEQVVLDFRAVKAVAAPNPVFLFHDVHEHNLNRGLAAIQAESGWSMRKLMATTSGMALVYPPAAASSLTKTLEVFAPDESLLKIIKGEVWRNSHPYQARLRRGISRVRDSLFRPEPRDSSAP